MVEDKGFTIALEVSVIFCGREARDLPVLAKQSARDSKFDVVICDENGVVPRIVVELMPGLDRSGRLSHGEIVDICLMW